MSLSRRIDADTLVYIDLARGFRSGGFNQYSPVVPRGYAAETTDSIEIGAKLTRFDGRVTLNAALFRNDQSDAQITRFNPASFTLENVAIDDVRSQGAELDFAAQVTPRLTLRASAGAVDSEIRAFAANPAVVGAAMPYVARYDVALSLTHERPLSASWRIVSRIAAKRSGPRSFTLDLPDLRSRPHTVVDARIGLEGHGWSLALVGDNVFDERQVEDLFGVFNGAVELARQPNAGRRIGIELRHDFGAARQ